MSEPTIHRFLAFDFGAESGRAILATLTDKRLTLEQTHRFANPNATMNGELQWDLLRQWTEIECGLSQTAARLGDGVTLDGIGVDTWGVDYGLLGHDGRILGNPVCYRDARTDGIMDRAFATVPRRAIYERTGLQFMQFNTLYQLMAAAAANDSRLDAARTLLFMPDLFNYLLTGIARAESSIASTSQMVDPRTGQWAIDVMTRLRIPAGLMPPIVPSGTVLGTLRPEVAATARLSPATRVIATAGHDTASAVAAVPAEGHKWAYLSSGTWSLIGVELPDAPLINDKAYDYNYTNEGGVGGSTRFLKNIMGLWLVQECRREFERQGRPYDYATLTAMATKSPANVSLIDVNDPRFLKPGEMPQKISAFCAEHGEPTPADDAAIVRCCLDSLALEYRRKLDGLEDVLGYTISTLHIVGGGVQNELLNQLTADATRKPVVAGPIEATAIGNVIVQALAVGAIPSLEAGRAIVRESFPVKRYEPAGDAEAARGVEAAYARFARIGGGAG